MKPGITFNIEKQSSEDPWNPAFPNPADFRFNYFKLLQGSPQGLATVVASPPPTVAVIGAGVAGLTAARELYRCGFSVTLFEASNRIGGRLFTQPNPNGNTQAGMEMGAMRMPFFSQPGDQNCILDYYLNYEKASTNPVQLSSFPNPGAAPGNTGIYINRGYGPNMEYPNPTLIPWPMGEPPQNTTLKELNEKVTEFQLKFTIAPKMYYTQAGNNWTTCWNQIAKYYDPLTFDDLVLLPALSAEEIYNKLTNLTTFDGNLGGFGMNREQASLLYTIGTGDGSWGAFYSIAALWFIRCTFFGFDSNLQTVEGFENAQNLPFYNQPTRSSNGIAMTPPLYQGIQCLPEYLFYVPPPGMQESLYQAVPLYLQTPVHSIEKQANGNINISYNDGQTMQFNYVIVASPQWATEMSMDFLGFSQDELPQQKLTTQNTQHNISSCKLFFPLKTQYWNQPGNLIPQIIITDTYIQDMYALNWNSRPGDSGVILASYTWEDDSLKLLPYSESELAAKVLKKLAEITISTTGQDITEYIDTNQPVMIQWITEPTYFGCAKLYRQNNEPANTLDLSYNQNFGASSKLYFVGENYGVEGGWTEPALRSALDCLVQLINNMGLRFNDYNFNCDSNYPGWFPYS